MMRLKNDSDEGLFSQLISICGIVQLTFRESNYVFYRTSAYMVAATNLHGGPYKYSYFRKMTIGMADAAP